jgi:hypothetical protein
MQTIRAALLICLVVAAPAFAADTVPTDASIQRLLAVTESRKLIDNAVAMANAAMDRSIKDAVAGTALDAKSQRVIEDTRDKVAALMKEMLAWKDLEPLIVDSYKRSLTQEEVNGLVAFYETPVGKSVVGKLPLIQQRTVQLMQDRMQALLPKMMQIQQEAVDKLKAGVK